MILTFRPIKVWPEGWQDPNRKRSSSPFSASYSSTLSELDRELRALNASGVSLQVDASDRDLRLDGQLRADAKVRHSGVILTIETKRLGNLIYATDRFVAWKGPDWQANLRAITLGLEALRAVDRYGISERGQQYAGYRELGTGIELGRAKMTLEEAARFLIEFGEWGDVDATVDEILGDTGPEAAEVLRSYFREAVKKLHPDVGGDPALFRKLTEARDLLEGRSS